MKPTPTERLAIAKLDNCTRARAQLKALDDGQRIMKQQEIAVKVKLNRGSSNATLWTCDLSHEYVSINADYRT